MALTSAQRRMIEGAMASPLQSINGTKWTAYLAGYSDQTVRIMQNAGYVTLNDDWVSYALTPKGPRELGHFVLGDEIECTQALAGSPQAQAAAALAKQAATVGVTADVDPRNPNFAVLRVSDLEKLLALARQAQVAAFAH